MASSFYQTDISRNLVFTNHLPHFPGKKERGNTCLVLLYTASSPEAQPRSCASLRQHSPLISLFAVKLPCPFFYIRKIAFSSKCFMPTCCGTEGWVGRSTVLFYPLFYSTQSNSISGNPTDILLLDQQLLWYLLLRHYVPSLFSTVLSSASWLRSSFSLSPSFYPHTQAQVHVIVLLLVLKLKILNICPCAQYKKINVHILEPKILKQNQVLSFTFKHGTILQSCRIISMVILRCIVFQFWVAS